MTLVSLTDQQRSTVLDGLYTKKLDLDRYLHGYPTSNEPERTDVCCDSHKARWQERLLQRDALRAQRAGVENLITLLEDPQPEQLALSADDVTLVFEGLDESGDSLPESERSQPLADVPASGTLIDQDGDPLDLEKVLLNVTRTRASAPVLTLDTAFIREEINDGAIGQKFDLLTRQRFSAVPEEAVHDALAEIFEDVDHPLHAALSLVVEDVVKTLTAQQP